MGTELLTIGKGVVTFDRLDDAGLPTGARAVGNAPVFSLGVAVEKKEHFSSQGGTKTKDLTVVLSAGMTGKLTLEELSAENIAAWGFGEVSGNDIILLSKTSVQGALECVGTNDVGQKLYVKLWKVALTPSADFNLIGEDFSTLEFDVEVLSDVDGHPASPYGIITPIPIS
jgi:hypothetical protein